ncbi:hypothetical protein [Riemerella anatipestifer]|uniref:hypothetical protein n=1 Tax=Riemerella anatipestifer TaxID=34085 RepID=UPI00162AAF0E
MGAFSYPDRYAGAFSTSNTQYKLYAVTGIPDRCLGKTTSACVGYGANVREHDFVYTPLIGPDGRVWLGNNLGAEYAKYGSAWFDPTRQAGDLDYTNTTTAVPLSNPTADQIKKDWRAYGSLFQWQRKPDGHELINWTSSISGTPKYTSTSALSNSWTSPNTNLWINGQSSGENSWVNSEINNIHPIYGMIDSWGVNGSNNPCPIGYTVPSFSYLNYLHISITGAWAWRNVHNSPAMWNEMNLRFPASGYRKWDYGVITAPSIVATAWSGDTSNYPQYTLILFMYESQSAMPEYAKRASGVGVRCLKD